MKKLTTAPMNLAVFGYWNSLPVHWKGFRKCIKHLYY